VRRSLVLLLAAFVLASTAGCHRGQVRLRLAPGTDRYVWRDPIDPEAFRAPAGRLLYTAEPPVGYAAARQRPAQILSIALRLNWNAAIRALPEAFDQLCFRHNTAKIALSEFTERQNKLELALSDLNVQKSRLDAVLAQYEAHLPMASGEAGDVRAAAEALLAQAKQINECAAARVAEVVPPELAPEESEGCPEGAVPP
jgi:hypothetical protein